jgi:hypothetical protein
MSFTKDVKFLYPKKWILKVEAAGSSETSQPSTMLHGIIPQKLKISIFIVVMTATPVRKFPQI